MSSKIDWTTMDKSSFTWSSYKTSDVSAAATTLLDQTYTSKTGRILAIALVPVYIPSNSAYTIIEVDGTGQTSSPCNNRQYQGPAYAAWTGNVGTSQIPIRLKLEGQGGVSFTVPAFKPYSLIVFDI